VVPLAWAGGNQAVPAGQLDEVLPGVGHRDPLFDVAGAGAELFVVGYPGLVLRSNDGGLNWTRQRAPTAAGLLAVDFVGPRRGWAVGRNGTIVATSDGGELWQAQAAGTAEHLLAVDFVDEKTGFAVGNLATALRSRDGGRSWQAMKVVSEGDPTLCGVALCDAATGVVVGELGLIARTSDGGNSFTRVDGAVPGDTLFGLAELGPEVLLAVGAGGRMVLSRDRGQTFTAVDSGVTDNLFGVGGVAGHVVVTGDAGTVLQAKDPAGPYVRVGVPAYRWINAVTVAPSGVAVAVGAGATVLRSADFGASWKRVGRR
jgi:photosystem II stability/assembly factor-like uncharacterized protein